MTEKTISIFIGSDVSLRSVAMCVLSADGDLIKEVDLDCEVNTISDYVRAKGSSVERISFEAGTNSQALFHGLTAEGFDVVCLGSCQVLAATSAITEHSCLFASVENDPGNLLLFRAVKTPVCRLLSAQSLDPIPFGKTSAVC
ncbi:MAG: hypothetical protein AAF583_02045 [Pseudomonadota bacterium]